MSSRRHAPCCLALMLALAAAPLQAASAPAESGAPAAAPESAEPASGAEAAPIPIADSRLAVLAIAVTGTADESTGPRLLKSLKKGLERGAFTLVDPAEVERHAPDGCSQSRCLTALRTQASAAFALRAKISVSDRDYVVHLDLLDTRTGNVLATSEERCDLCGSAEVGTLVETQSALLRRALEDIIQGPSRLVVDSQPAGALVLVDNQLIGTTPVDQPVLEGEHVVRVMLDGYVSDERKVKLQRGVRERLDLQLRRAPRLARSRSFGWASLFTGIPVLAVGVGLLAIDGTQKKCSDRAKDINGSCPFVYNTDLGGAAALAGGAVLITIGAMLLLRTRDRPQPRRPRAFIGPTGFTVVGRF
ncbi:MAG: PEGA domain-containing protein [Nannocystis sp.]|nr:PEGA domain-containing protein [Nannocystis sp.]MBA3545990.1 PEGA domain-containing protein [Nannocystis sp.]